MRVPQTFIVNCNDDQMMSSNQYEKGVIIPHRELACDSYGGESNDLINAEVRWLFWDGYPVPKLEVGKQYIISIQETEGMRKEQV